MTSPTIIQQPGAIDQAAGAFMQSYAMSRGLAQKRQELELEKQKVASQTALEGAQASEARDRAKKLEQEIEDTNNMQIGLRFAQAHLNNLDDDQAFSQDTASLDPVQRGYAMSARDVLRQTRADIASRQGRRCSNRKPPRCKRIGSGAASWTRESQTCWRATRASSTRLRASKARSRTRPSWTRRAPTCWLRRSCRKWRATGSPSMARTDGLCSWTRRRARCATRI